MNTEKMTYSSVHLRERDKFLSDKHQKEIAILEKKLQKAKFVSDETAKHLFDAVNRGRKLAQSLGFDDVYNAQFAIDSADHDMSFHECYDRLDKLDDQISVQKKEISSLETKLHNAEEKVKELQTNLEARTLSNSSTESSLREQLRRLNEQYDALKDVKERAAERYKVDFKKWRAFKDWLFAEDTKHRRYRNESGITPEEKRERDMASIMRKKQKMLEIGPDLARFEGEPEDGDIASANGVRPPPLGRIEMDSDKENEGTPQRKKRRISITPTSNPTPSTVKKQSRPPTITPPMPSRHSLMKSVTNMAVPSPSPRVFLGSLNPLNAKESSTPLQSSVLAKQPQIPNSSDTEDDSQAVYNPPISGTPGVNNVASPTGHKGRPRQVENKFTTPVMTRPSSQKRKEDYSAFKGRGRYGNSSENNPPGDTTINAQYTIEPNQNGGVNYQYDLVVRNKNERRRLDAGDCECCREYYDGVGPLPSRLQPPLWRSPSVKPDRPCLRQSHSLVPEGQHPPGSLMRNEKRSQTDTALDHVESHKKAISRHRHAWARADTPPGYWDIGFPDTQAVGDINEKAKQMHKKKKAEIDKEARNESGRYRRK